MARLGTQEKLQLGAMARLNAIVCSDDELPNPSTLLQCVKSINVIEPVDCREVTISKANRSLSPRRGTAITENPDKNKKKASKQRNLGSRKLGPSFLSCNWDVITIGEQDKEHSKEDRCAGLRRSPRKYAKLPTAYVQYALASAANSPVASESSFDEVYDDSETESSPESLCNRLSELRFPKSPSKEQRLSLRKREIDILPRQLFPQVPRLTPSHSQPSSRGVSQDATFSAGSYLESTLSDQGEQPSSVLRL